MRGGERKGGWARPRGRRTEAEGWNLVLRARRGSAAPVDADRRGSAGLCRERLNPLRRARRGIEPSRPASQPQSKPARPALTGGRHQPNLAARKVARARSAAGPSHALGVFRHATMFPIQPRAYASPPLAPRAQAGEPDGVPAVGDAEDAPPGVQGVGVRACGAAHQRAEAGHRR